MVNKRSFLILFTTLNIIFIAAQVYKHTRIVQLNYAQSKLLTDARTSEHTIESLRQQICAHKDITAIKKYAQEELHMKPLSLTKVKRITL